MKYGQFCPIAKAAEVIGERWTLLVLRELLSGSTRYAELKRGLGRISSSVLSTRIKALIEHGIVERVEADTAQGHRQGQGQGQGQSQGPEYRLTPAGLELAPVMESVAVWGHRWARSRMTRDELDVELLMLQVQRYFDVRAFGKNHAAVGFVFSDLRGAQRRWWLLVDDGSTDLCVQSPGRVEDVVLVCNLRTLAEVFAGVATVEAACATKRLDVRGPPPLVRSVHRWLRPSSMATKLREASP